MSYNIESDLFVSHYKAALRSDPLGHFALKGFDDLVGGIMPSRLTAIMGAPGSAKTTLAVQLAVDAARQGFIVVFVSAELSAPAIIAKAIAQLSGTSLINGYLPGVASPEMGSAAEVFGREVAPNLYLVDEAVRALDLAAEVSRIKAEHSDRHILVFVDYVQILPTVTNYGDERLEAKETISALRSIASTTQASIFAITSMNRSNYDKPIVNLDAIAAYSGIDYSCDTVLYLSVDGDDKAKRATNMSLRKRPMVLRTVKSRYAPFDVKRVWLQAATATFTDA